MLPVPLKGPPPRVDGGSGGGAVLQVEEVDPAVQAGVDDLHKIGSCAFLASLRFMICLRSSGHLTMSGWPVQPLPVQEPPPVFGWPRWVTLQSTLELGRLDVRGPVAAPSR